VNVPTRLPAPEDRLAYSDDDEARRARFRRNILIALGVVLLAGILYWLFKPEPAPPPPPTPTVTVAQPLVREVTAWDDYVGRFAPSRTVEVRPRVAGEVFRVHFRDGSIVRRGQLLFTIDPRPFAAQVAEARADAASQRSTLALARADLARANRLVGDEAISKAELDALRARVQSAQAAVAAADARVRTRALNLEFTAVRAPISGRISDRRVDAGNQVAGGEGTGGTVLTVINALDPIYFTFDGSEALFLKAQRARRGGADITPVEIRLQDESDYRWRGRLDFTDNGLDTRSGTIRARAVVANPDLFLTPGLFGNMRLGTSGTQRAMLVPDTAIQVDQASKAVLVVGADSKVVMKSVQLGPVVDGLRVIRSGLLPFDRVVISGTQLAMPGSVVKVAQGKIAPTPAKASTPSATEPAAAEATFAR
jgi:RND family efflux transporter MFP subunit